MGQPAPEIAITAVGEAVYVHPDGGKVTDTPTMRLLLDLLPKEGTFQADEDVVNVLVLLTMQARNLEREKRLAETKLFAVTRVLKEISESRKWVEAHNGFPVSEPTEEADEALYGLKLIKDVTFPGASKIEGVE
jgi:hypothetical protein